MNTKIKHQLFVLCLTLTISLHSGCFDQASDSFIDRNAEKETHSAEVATTAQSPSVAESSTDDTITDVVTPLSQAERVRDSILSFQLGVCSEDEVERIAVLEKIMPSQTDFARLFGEVNGSKVWSLFQRQLTEMRQNTDKLKEKFESGGPLVEITVTDSRKHDEELGGRFADLFEAMPADIPVFEAIAKYEKRTTGSSSYLVIDDRVVFIRGLDRIHRFLVTEGQKKQDSK